MAIITATLHLPRVIQGLKAQMMRIDYAGTYTVTQKAKWGFYLDTGFRKCDCSMCQRMLNTCFKLGKPR